MGKAKLGEAKSDACYRRLKILKKTIKVKVLYWAQAREAAGKKEEYYTIQKGSSVEDLIEDILERHPSLGSMKSIVRIAVNGQMITDNEELKDGDIVAILPPFAGG